MYLSVYAKDIILIILKTNIKLKMFSNIGGTLSGLGGTVSSYADAL